MTVRGIGRLVKGNPQHDCPEFDAVVRKRPGREALEDPHLEARGVRHRHAGATDVDGAFTVPVAAFGFADGGPRVDTPPPGLGQHTAEILTELGYGDAEQAKLRAAHVI